MTNPFSTPLTEATQREYHLRARIHVYEVTYEDEQSQGNLGLLTRKLVAFIPTPTTEMYAFFDAWLAEPGKTVELIVKNEHPFHRFVRCAVLHPYERDPKLSRISGHHHLHLMNFGLSEIIIAQPSLYDTEIDLVALPENTDHSDGSPTDSEVRGDELYAGTRKDVPLPARAVSPDLRFTPDRRGRPAPKLQG